MATRISVTVTGPIGLDDPDQLLGELKQATELSWQLRTVEQDKVLSGGIVEIVLTAIVTKSVEMSMEAAVESVKKLVKRWRNESLDPPDIRVDTESLPDNDTTDERGTGGADD